MFAPATGTIPRQINTNHPIPSSYSAWPWPLGFRTRDTARPRCRRRPFGYRRQRFKEMFISGGENVYAAEVEAVFLEHPPRLMCLRSGKPSRLVVGREESRSVPGEKDEVTEKG